MKKILFSVVICLFAFNIQAQDFDTAKMDSLFDRIEEQQKAMGSFSLFRDGEEIYQRSIGFADVEKDIYASGETVYRIGSISKTFTSAMVLKLVEEGKLELNTKLQEFYPEIPKAQEITMEHLLKQQSGLFNFTNDAAYAGWMEFPKTKDEMLEIFKEKGTVFEPGERFEYSNTNYVLLSYILEDITGKEFKELFQEMIVKPLELEDTYYGGRIDSGNKEAYSYNRSKEWELSTETDPSIPLGAGGIVSNPTDLNKFFTALFNGRIITQTSLEQMKETTSGYGMGLIEFPFYEKRAYGHTGGIDSFIAMAGYFPEEDISMSYCINATEIPGNDIAVGMLSILFNREYEIPHFEPEYEVAQEDLESYTGVYGSESFPLKLTIFEKDGALYAQATGQPAFPLQASGEHQFKFDTANVTMEFLPEADKMIFTQGGTSFELAKE